MADFESVRQRIIASVFSKRSPNGDLDETYIAHVKIWEDAGPEGAKPRYILLSRASPSCMLPRVMKLKVRL
jgi:hypothetical protein